MKTLRLFGMAMMAILMGASLSSCSKDENPKVDEKKLARISYTDGDYTQFTYDDKGRVIVTEDISMSEGCTWKETMVWEDDAVKITTIEKGYEAYPNNYTLSLVNGLVKERFSSDSGLYTFDYNKSNRLIEWGKEGSKISIIWDGDRMVSVKRESSNITITYGRSCEKGYFPFFGDTVGTWFYIYNAHPELAGLRSTQIPEIITYTYDSGKSSVEIYSYEFDQDGYISKIIVSGETNTRTYTLTWE